jgi:hypothetical protein
MTSGFVVAEVQENENARSCRSAAATASGRPDGANFGIDRARRATSRPPRERVQDTEEVHALALTQTNGARLF